MIKLFLKSFYKLYILSVDVKTIMWIVGEELTIPSEISKYSHKGKTYL